MSTIKELKLNSFSDERGSLIAIEAEKDVPFKINRTYYMYNLSANNPRGFHAHKNLEQFVICLQGSCQIKLDDGFKENHFTLDSPKKGLIIRKLIWREMYNFKDNCILMVLASHHYDEDDYIRNYNDFIDHIRSG